MDINASRQQSKLRNENCILNNAICVDTLYPSLYFNPFHTPPFRSPTRLFLHTSDTKSPTKHPVSSNLAAKLHSDNKKRVSHRLSRLGSVAEILNFVIFKM